MANCHSIVTGLDFSAVGSKSTQEGWRIPQFIAGSKSTQEGWKIPQFIVGSKSTPEGRKRPQ
jgi:hypothetical protein